MGTPRGVCCLHKAAIDKRKSSPPESGARKRDRAMNHITRECAALVSNVQSFFEGEHVRLGVRGSNESEEGSEDESESDEEEDSG